MYQVKYVFGIDMPDLIDRLNRALSDIKATEKPNIIYDRERVEAIIEYETEEEYKKRLCCECQHWDDSNGTSDVSGFCQLTGHRKRFNCNACESYKDIRA